MKKISPSNPQSKKHWILKNPYVAAVVVPLLCIVVVTILSIPITILMRLLPVYATASTHLNSIAEAFGRYFAVLVAVLAMKKSSNGTFHFGFTKKNLKQSILLSLFVLVEVVVSLIQGLLGKEEFLSTPLAILMAISLGIGAGVFEEPVCRGIVMSNAMSKWIGKKHRILLSVLVSAIFFGLMHILSLPQHTVGFVVMQIIHAFGIGIYFGAVYARCRNIWGPIIAHSLFDIGCFIFASYGRLATEDIVWALISSILFISVGLFLIRPSKHADIEALWNDQPVLNDCDKNRE